MHSSNTYCIGNGLGLAFSLVTLFIYISVSYSNRVSVVDVGQSLELPFGSIGIFLVKLVSAINGELSGEVVASSTLSHLNEDVASSVLFEFGYKVVVLADAGLESAT